MSLWFIFSLLLLAIIASMVEASASNNDNLSLLMVGNSYTDANDLEGMVKALLEEDMVSLATKDIYALRMKKGAAQLHDYMDSNDTSSGSFANILKERKWTWVVLQEQSQVSGFWSVTDWQDDWNASLKAVKQLNNLIANDGASTVLLMTWGRFEKDINNPTTYPDFNTMQDLVSKGYYKYRDAISNPQRPVMIAPAGLAFKAVHDEYVERGEDPVQPNTNFARLYNPEDGHHPSLEGSYLVACTIYQTMTGHDVTQRQYKPAELDTETRDRLQRVAYETVVNFKQTEGAKPYSPPSSESSSEPKKQYVPSDGNNGNSSSSSSSGSRIFPLLVFALGLYVMYALRDRLASKMKEFGGSSLSLSPQPPLSSRYAPVALDESSAPGAPLSSGLLAPGLELSDVLNPPAATGQYHTPA